MEVRAEWEAEMGHLQEELAHDQKWKPEQWIARMKDLLCVHFFVLGSQSALLSP